MKNLLDVLYVLLRNFPVWKSSTLYMVGVLKKELTKLVGLSLLTYFELTSQLAEIEGIINSRPLIKFGSEDVLTPNSILTGENNPNDILNVLDSQQILAEAQEARNNLPKLFQETSKRRAQFWLIISSKIGLCTNTFQLSSIIIPLTKKDTTTECAAFNPSLLLCHT